MGYFKRLLIAIEKIAENSWSQAEYISTQRILSKAAIENSIREHRHVDEQLAHQRHLALCAVQEPKRSLTNREKSEMKTLKEIFGLTNKTKPKKKQAKITLPKVDTKKVKKLNEGVN